jgi:hypothetical protein
LWWGGLGLFSTYWISLDAEARERKREGPVLHGTFLLASCQNLAKILMISYPAVHALLG